MGSYNKAKQQAKRTAARVHQNLDRAANELANLYAMFAPSHPDEAELIGKLGQGVLLILEEVEKLWLRSWGDFPENWDNWT